MKLKTLFLMGALALGTASTALAQRHQRDVQAYQTDRKIDRTLDQRDRKFDRTMTQMERKTDRKLDKAERKADRKMNKAERKTGRRYRW